MLYMDSNILEQRKTSTSYFPFSVRHCRLENIQVARLKVQVSWRGFLLYMCTPYKCGSVMVYGSNIINMKEESRPKTNITMMDWDRVIKSYNSDAHSPWYNVVSPFWLSFFSVFHIFNVLIYFTTLPFYQVYVKLWLQVIGLNVGLLMTN